MSDVTGKGASLRPRFGDTIENGWASEDNPTRVGIFVREGRRTGRLNPGRYFEVTDGNGKFWELPVTTDHKITVTPAALTPPTEPETPTWRDGRCYECGVDLVGPYCPACNPTEPPSALLAEAEAFDVDKFDNVDDSDLWFTLSKAKYLIACLSQALREARG